MEDMGKLTLKNAVITKDTTSIEFLLNNVDYLCELAECFKDDKQVSEICSSHGCGNCPLHQRNFHTESLVSISLVGGTDTSMGCLESRQAVIALANSINLLETLSKSKKTTGKCISCKNFVKQGEWFYCNAWHNFTVEDMYCGYYQKMLDK